MYADDVVIAGFFCTSRATVYVHVILSVCEEYAKEFSVTSKMF